MLLLHAILPTDAVEPPEAGLRGWPLREVRVAGLAAWATACADATFSPQREDLLTGHALLEEALGACLPVRFPTLLPDEGAVRELLERRRGDLLAALGHVRGRVELAVTVTWAEGVPTVERPPPGLATTPGRRFLEQRRRWYASADRRRAEAERLASLLQADPRVVQACHTLCPSEEIALSSALLVSVEEAGPVRKRLQALHESVRILVNGPWPPYSFVSLEG